MAYISIDISFACLALLRHCLLFHFLRDSDTNGMASMPCGKAEDIEFGAVATSIVVLSTQSVPSCRIDQVVRPATWRGYACLEERVLRKAQIIVSCI